MLAQEDCFPYLRPYYGLTTKERSEISKEYPEMPELERAAFLWSRDNRPNSERDNQIARWIAAKIMDT